jgi:hypothetical protein
MVYLRFAGKILESIGWKMIVLEAIGGATQWAMKLGQTVFSPFDQAAASQSISQVRSSLRRELLPEELLLLGSVS